MHASARIRRPCRFCQRFYILGGSSGSIAAHEGYSVIARHLTDRRPSGSRIPTDLSEYLWMPPDGGSPPSPGPGQVTTLPRVPLPSHLLDPLPPCAQTAGEKSRIRPSYACPSSAIEVT